MFGEMMRQTFGLATYGSTDDRGVETFAARADYACRWEPVSKLMTDTSGQKVVSSGVLYTEQPVTVADRVYPPGAATLGESRKPISVETHYDLESGLISHYRVTL